MQSNYGLFYEVLCRSLVPIALVITHLEREADMEKWWQRNVESLEKYGIEAVDHACVTRLQRVVLSLKVPYEGFTVVVMFTNAGHLVSE